MTKLQPQQKNKRRPDQCSQTREAEDRRQTSRMIEGGEEAQRQRPEAETQNREREDQEGERLEELRREDARPAEFETDQGGGERANNQAFFEVHGWPFSGVF